MADPDVGSRTLVERIWAAVADEQSTRPQPILGAPPEFEQLIHDEERRYINAHCRLDTTPADLPPSGYLKRWKGRCKRRAAHFVVAVLGPYFADEHEFMAHLVRLQNKLTVNHDRLGHEIRALHAALKVESERLRNSSAVLHDRLEERIADLEHAIRLAGMAPVADTA